jgi:hypothetical protein
MRARELEEAGAATAVTQGRVDNELEGIGQALRGGRPSKVEDNKRRCIAATMAETGVEHEADATDVTTAVADGTLADGAQATSEANAGDTADGAAGPKKKKLKKRGGRGKESQARHGPH